MLKRTSINHVNDILNKNPDWKILDIGCGYNAHKNATVIADVQDLADFYKDKNFIRIKEKIFPFKDKDFDFVISSHVIEHVEDFEFFIKELERISSKGYIELPTRMGDNFIFENVNDHIWWFKYDDVDNRLVASKKNQLVDPFITVSSSRNFFEKIFRESFVIELAWQEKIEYIIDDEIKYEKFKKMSFFQIIRKYLSKKIRSIYK